MLPVRQLIHALLLYSASPLTLMTVIENIGQHREPQPQFEAIYMLMPTTQNVDRIIKDFENVKQYAEAHLFFIEGECSVSLSLYPRNGQIHIIVVIGLPEDLLQRLFTSPAEPHLKELKELFLNFSREFRRNDIMFVVVC